MHSSFRLNHCQNDSLADPRATCLLCASPYYEHLPLLGPLHREPSTPSFFNSRRLSTSTSTNLSLPSLSTPVTLPNSMQGYLQPPASPLASVSTGNSGLLLAPANVSVTGTRWPAASLPSWSPPGPPVLGTANDRRLSAHGLGVSQSPLSVIPTLRRRQAARSVNVAASSSTCPTRLTSMTQRRRETTKYLVVLHPEPVSFCTVFDLRLLIFICPRCMGWCTQNMSICSEKFVHPYRKRSQVSFHRPASLVLSLRSKTVFKKTILLVPYSINPCVLISQGLASHFLDPVRIHLHH